MDEPQRLQKSSSELIYLYAVPICHLDFFTPWSNWSECSGSCGVGMRTRMRQCEIGKKCIGPCEQVEKCYAGCRNDECPSKAEFD